MEFCDIHKITKSKIIIFASVFQKYQLQKERNIIIQ